MHTRRFSKRLYEKESDSSVSNDIYSTLPGSLEGKNYSYDETSPFLGAAPEPADYNIPQNQKSHEFTGHKYLRSQYTALPFHRYINEKTPVKMVNLTANHMKKPKYIIAPDGYIPNSNIGKLYENMSRAGIVKRPAIDYEKEKKEKLIKDIIEKHLNLAKIANVKQVNTSRINKKLYKSHFVHTLDPVTMSNDVIENFNFELEKAKSDKSEEVVISKRKRKEDLASKRKKLTLPSIQDKRSIKSDLLAKEDEEIKSEPFGHDEYIDIDLLDKLEKHIQAIDMYGSLENAIIQQKIMKDKQFKISDSELKHLLDILETALGSVSEVYNTIKLIVNNDSEALTKIEELIPTRQSRLGFINTITDPQHIFHYLLQFYDNASDLLDDIEEALNGTNLHTFEKLISYCGDKRKVQAFLSSFMAAKNFANTFLTTKFTNITERLLMLENGLRGKLNENMVLYLFMSSENDARMFFQYILECKIKEMMAILDDMKKINTLKDMFESSKVLLSKSQSSTTSIVETKSFQQSTSTVIEEPKASAVVSVPALPTYNEASWKVLMSQYLAQMVSTLSPTKSGATPVKDDYPVDLNFQQMMKEFTFMHHEVVKLLKVYLNDDVETAKRLLEGLVGEDDMAIQATIELLGEKEAIQIVKGLRLKQAKLIEKIIEFRGNEEETREAKLVYRSMLHTLPETLSTNLNKWLEAEDVDAKDIKKALHVLMKPDEESSESYDLSDGIVLFSTDETSKEFFSTVGRKRTFSVVETIVPSFMTYPKAVDFETVPEAKPVPEKMSTKNYKLDMEYREMKADAENIVDITSSSKLKNVYESESVHSESSEETSEFTAKVKVLGETDKLITPKLTLVPSVQWKEKKKVCIEICDLSLEKPEMIEHYAEILNDLTEQITVTMDVDQMKNISSAIINIAEQISHVPERLSIKGLPEKLLLLGETLTQSLSVTYEDQPVKYQKEDTEKSDNELEKTIMESFIKQQKIETVIQILKKIDQNQAIELEKLLQTKKNVCSLYLPEVRDQKGKARQMGLPEHQPFQLFIPTPDSIMRSNLEEINRHTIKSNKVDDFTEMDYLRLQTDEMGFIPTFEGAADIFESLSSKETPSEIRQILKPELPQEDESEVKVEEEQEPTKRISMRIRDPIPLKTLTLDADIFQPEITEADEVIMKEEKSIEYEVVEAKLIRKPSLPKTASKDPYNDFRSFYGFNTFYLPFINPTELKKINSGEYPLPKYDSSDKTKSNVIFQHLQNQFDEKKVSDPKTVNLFNKTRVIKRPSNIPLNDWVRIGAPGMSSNMILPDMHHKSTNSRCRFQHLSKLRFHKYGLSTSNYLQRIDLLDYITKANASEMNEKMRMKILAKRSCSTKSDSFSVSVID